MEVRERGRGRTIAVSLYSQRQGALERKETEKDGERTRKEMEEKC